MTTEEHEALARRYDVAAIVTPLDNGKFAVFANDRGEESMVICDEIGLAIVVRDRANRPGSTRRLPRMMVATQPQSIEDGTTPDEYGI